MKPLVLAMPLLAMAFTVGNSTFGPCVDQGGRPLDKKECAFQKAQAGQVSKDTLSPRYMSIYPQNGPYGDGGGGGGGGGGK
jgi:hypothetical protein